MKQVLLSLLLFSIVACSNKGGDADKRAQLEKLKKDQTDLREKISKLEAELASADTTGGASKAKIVAVTEMKSVLFNHYIEIQARVEGDEDVTVSPESMGNITSLTARPGDQVRKGEVLAVVDDRLIRQGIAEVQSQLDLVTQLFNKQKNLWEQKIGSEVQFLQAKTNKEALEKRMASMQEQLDMTRIKSPINGTVDEVNIKIGQTVAPGLPAFRVVNLNSLKVTGEVAESYISKLNRGNEVLIYFPDINKEIKGKLDYSGKAINKLNRTFNVEVRLQSSEGEYHPNMVAVLKIVDYTSPKAYVLPLAAVQKSSDGEFVYVASEENGKLAARRKNVSTGIIYNGMAEIKTGLAEGDKVVTLGYQSIIEGDNIRF